MDFRVLAVGDVVGNPGLEQIRRNLRQMKRQYHADFAVVNGENAAVVGITPNQADSILDAGADIITMGNHTWSKREIVPYMDDCPWIIRPANYALRFRGGAGRWCRRRQATWPSSTSSAGAIWTTARKIPS